MEPPPPTSDTSLLVVESDDGRVQMSGTWATHDTAEASSGRYLYSSGSPEDSLNLSFFGSRVDVIFVQHPALGSFTLVIDDTPVQTLNSAAPNAVFGARISLSLGAGTHTLRIVPLSGVVAIDAFAVEAASEPPAPPTQEPTDEPVTPEPTDEPPLVTPLPTDGVPTTPEPPSGPTPDSPANFGRG